MRESQFVRNHSIFELMTQASHNFTELAPAFPSKTLAEIEEIFYDNRLSLRRTYERFGYLGIRECSSKNFNIGSDGARSNGTSRISSSGIYKIHCYGGSTTVGDGVADNQTISAHLGSKLNSKSKVKIEVFNFGAGNHTSLHSTLRLLDHCLSGNIPDQVVFLNGFNDCYYSAGGADGVMPFFDEILRRSQDSEFRNTTISEIVDLIPNSSKEDLAFTTSHLPSELIEKCLANIKLRYASAVAIQRFIESSFGVKVHRFIEPNQAINCRVEQRLLPRISESNLRIKLVGALYKEIENIGMKKFFGHGVASLIDINQDKQTFPLYLDGVHFSPAMNEMLASHIVGFIKFKRVLSKRETLRFEVPVTSKEELLNPNNYPLF